MWLKKKKVIWSMNVFYFKKTFDLLKIFSLLNLSFQWIIFFPSVCICWTHFVTLLHFICRRETKGKQWNVIYLFSLTEVHSGRMATAAFCLWVCVWQSCTALCDFSISPGGGSVKRPPPGPSKAWNVICHGARAQRSASACVTVYVCVSKMFILYSISCSATAGSG